MTLKQLDKEYCAAGLIYPTTNMYEIINVIDVDNNERPCQATQDTLRPEFKEQFTPDNCRQIIIDHSLHFRISNVMRWITGQGQPIAIACYACLLSEITPGQRILCKAIGRVVKTANT